MFGLIKKMMGANKAPRPEVELQEIFRKLQGANQLALTALHININHLYVVLGIEDRLVNFLMPGQTRNHSKEKVENFEYLTKVFEMSKSFEEKGMSAESVAANMIALFFACHILSGTIEEVFNQQKAQRIFKHFKYNKVIDLDPPRRRLPPIQ